MLRLASNSKRLNAFRMMFLLSLGPPIPHKSLWHDLWGKGSPGVSD